jgi:hypothetical protein
MDSTTLGNTIQIVTIIPGGFCIGLAALGLIGNMIKKKELER